MLILNPPTVSSTTEHRGETVQRTGKHRRKQIPGLGNADVLLGRRLPGSPGACYDFKKSCPYYNFIFRLIELSTFGRLKILLKENVKTDHTLSKLPIS